MEFIIMQYRNILRIALLTAFILLLPLVAMLFTDEVAWEAGDFIAAAVLLFGAGLTYELIVRKSTIVAYRAAVGLAIVTAFILIWVNLAVGLIGNESNSANLMYVGVLAIGVIGAIIARLRSHGMVFALSAMALAQTLVAVIALIVVMRQYPEAAVTGTMIANAFFVALWAASALLFKHASTTTAKPA